MSQLQNRKCELETLRDQWRGHNAAHPNDANGANTLREVESQLATVNTQIIRGPGAAAAISAARGRAAIAAQRNPQSAQALPTPAPMPTAQSAAPSRPSFVSETDVPYPPRARSAAETAHFQNGRFIGQPQAAAPPQVQPSDAAPTATPDAPKAAPRYSWQGENDVPMPPQTRSVGEQTVRENGRR